MRRKSKSEISVVQRKLWEHCKRIIRATYPSKCYTCGKRIYSNRDKQTGHVPWPKSVLGAFLKYDLRVLRIQCTTCNIWRGGMGAEAYKIMLKEIGPEAMALLEKDRQKTVNALTHYKKLLKEYENIRTV